MTTDHDSLLTAAWTAVAPTLSETVPLPLWQPATAAKAGYQSVDVSVSDVRVRQAWPGLDSTAVMAGWGIVASRHLQTSKVVVGLLETAGSSKSNTVWPQLLDVQPAQSVQDYCATVERNRNHGLTVSNVLHLLGWPDAKQLMNTLVALGEGPLSAHALDPWANALRSHRCSLLLVVAANQGAPALQLVFDRAVYSAQSIQQLGEQLAAVLGALAETQG
ncbi:hypothetical protein H4R34_001608, partial [Dimargaris verticillata]